MPSDAELAAEWTAKFGPDGAAAIRATVDANMPHYDYLKAFALQPEVLN